MKTNIRYRLISIALGICLAVILSLGTSITVDAQSIEKNSLLRMIDDDHTTIDIIAGYDTDIQRNILQVSQTPEALYKLAELQKRSQSQFRTIIKNYDQETQSGFYDLARYPDLISSIAERPRPSTSDLIQITSAFPEDIRSTAIKYGRSNYYEIVEIDRLNNEIDRAFKFYLEPYDARTKESVNVLLAYPEVVTALVDDMEFTTQLGIVYYQDPQWVSLQLRQISAELEQQNRADLNAYQNQLMSDPDAYRELLDASEKFARENNEVRSYQSNTPIVEINVIRNYPYWFGYPYWYSAPIWRPYPVWYHTGFYRNNYGRAVFVRLPSYNFIHWHTHYHPTLFPHLSYNYYSYYENHYTKHYQSRPKHMAYPAFYRSIEVNIIKNPKVNNVTLKKIDTQRGQNIVRQPNSTPSTSVRRGSSATNNSSSSYGNNSTTTSGRRGNEGMVNRSTSSGRSNTTATPSSATSSGRSNSTTSPARTTNTGRNNSTATPARSTNSSGAVNRSQNSRSYVRPTESSTYKTPQEYRSERSSTTQPQNSTRINSGSTTSSSKSAGIPSGRSGSDGVKSEATSRRTTPSSTRGQSSVSSSPKVSTQPSSSKRKSAATVKSETKKIESSESNGRRQ